MYLLDWGQLGFVARSKQRWLQQGFTSRDLHRGLHRGYTSGLTAALKDASVLVLLVAAAMQPERDGELSMRS